MADSFLLYGFVFMLTSSKPILHGLERLVQFEALDEDEVILCEMKNSNLELILCGGIFTLENVVETILADSDRLTILFDLFAKVDSVS